jgi:hypothetical protein
VSPRSRRREDNSSARAGITSDRRGSGIGRWCGALPGGDGPASVLLNCESGSGASLGAPLVGCPCERAPSARRSACAGRGGSRSLTGQGPAGWQHLVGYSLAIDGRCVQRRFGGLAGCDGWRVRCVQAEFGHRCAGFAAPGEILVWMVPVHDGLNLQRWRFCVLEHEKGIRWMPWHQEAMKDVARCEKPRGAASRR